MPEDIIGKQRKAEAIVGQGDKVSKAACSIDWQSKAATIVVGDMAS